MNFDQDYTRTLVEMCLLPAPFSDYANLVAFLSTAGDGKKSYRCREAWMLVGRMADDLRHLGGRRRATVLSTGEYRRAPGIVRDSLWFWWRILKLRRAVAAHYLTGGDQWRIAHAVLVELRNDILAHESTMAPAPA